MVDSTATSAITVGDDSTSSSDDTAPTTTEDVTSTSTSSTTTTEDVTSSPVDPPPWCDDDGVCEAGELGCFDCISCGNGELDPGEECDDNNNDNTDACVDNCRSASCGDGHVQQDVELCDDGADNLPSDAYDPFRRCSSGPDEAQACKSYAPHCGDGGECTPEDAAAECSLDCPTVDPPAECGNGLVEAGEACDEGAADTAACNGATAGDMRCKLPVCGDAYLNTAADEECDDGNGDNTDDCVLGCKIAVCGDGVVRSSELCDDGNTDEKDDCDNACRPIRTVFVTSVSYNGAQIGGVAGANAKCNAHGGAAGLQGPFRAWLSDGTNSAAMAFSTSSNFTGTYRRVDGALVAVGWAGWTSAHMAPINRDENGTMKEPSVWTNSTPAGLSASGSHCTNWSATTGSTVVGTASAMDATWTNIATQSCAGGRALYCVQDK